MPSRITSKILQHANDIKDIEERVNWLRENATYAVRGLLNFNFHNVKFLLPEGEPDLKGLKIQKEAEDYVLGTEFSHLNHEMKKMYLFYEGGHQTLQQHKRESLWVTLITGLHATERDDVTHMKDKKLEKKYPNITREVAHLAFPDLVEKPTPIKELLRDGKGRFIKKDKPKKKGKSK
jgi:hypothetical protein